jgi:GTPase Era involved in 16S rRNA processing
MIVGNHSAGKSSFINWYVGKPGLLKTSMAIETKGITFVAHGAKDDEYGSDGTLRKFPEIVNIAEETGDKNIVGCLSTQLSTSADRLFPLVTFIDTPGLVDTTEYPFKVNEGIEAMSEYCDKVLVFMDPMGKATCSRTMDVIQLLQNKCPSKTGFYLTKADSIDNQRDAMNVALQICKVSRFGSFSFVFLCSFFRRYFSSLSCVSRDSSATASSVPASSRVSSLSVIFKNIDA